MAVEVDSEERYGYRQGDVIPDEAKLTEAVETGRPIGWSACMRADRKRWSCSQRTRAGTARRRGK